MPLLSAVAILLLAAAPAFATAGATVITADGERHAGTLLRLDAAGEVVLRVGKESRKIKAADVRAVAFDGVAAEDLMDKAGRHVVVASDGSVLAVKDAAVADGKLTAASDAAGGLSLAVQHVVRLLRPRPHERPSDLERQRALLAAAARDKDLFVVADPSGGWTSVAGILQSLQGGKLRLTYEGDDIEMDASSVAIVETAATGRAETPQPVGHVLCADGSRVAFAALSLKAGTLEVTSAALGQLRIDPAKVAEVRFRAAGHVFLSDLEPASVRHTPFFDESFDHRRDRSVVGGPLRLGGRSYAKGLGLHARCELRYELGGAYRRLAAVAGIDDSVLAGAAVLSIRLDGKAAGKPLRLDRTQAPEAIRLDVSRARTMTLLVDFAPGTFGSGARVALCDAVLSK